MTDEREPTTNDPAPNPATDATSRTPTPSAIPTPTTHTAPTAPLTPPGRASGTPTTYEHEVAWASGPAAASPVVPPAKPRRAGRVRWAASLVVVAVVILASAVVAALITGGSSTAAVMGYVPDGTTAYGEVRLDLPGDQRRAIGEFLQKFPGFADQASLDTKLDQVVDDLIKNVTDGSQTYTTDIKPWFDGEIAFSLGALPKADSFMSGQASETTAMSSLRALVLVSIKDPAAAQAWFDAAIAKTGAKTTSEAYNGATLTVFGTSGGVTGALALIDGRVAVAGDITSVKAAVDTKGSGGFAGQPGPKSALDAMSGDHVGFVYVALRPLLDWSNELNNAIPKPSGAPTAAMADEMLKAIPDWGAYWLRFERDALVMDAVAPKPAIAIGPTENRASTVAEHVPATVIVAAVGHDFGKTLKHALDLSRSDASLKPMFDQLDGALGLVGGEDAAFGWIGDVAIVISAPDGTPEGGLVVTPTDAAAARQLFTSLRSFVALAGSQQGITLRDETYNGTMITVVDLGDLAKLSGAVGAASGIPPLPAGHVEIAYAVTDQIVVIGSGPGFVKHVLDTTRETSLASNQRYKTLADRAGIGTGTTFVDVTAIREAIEKTAAGSADAAAMAKYERDIKPFLVPFDALVGSSSVSGDMTRSTVYITVK